MDTLGRHTLAISEDGKVFSWGSSTEGQLGHGMCEPSHIPRLILSLDGIKVVQVECGWNHSLCLSADGRVFAFGSGDEGKLGLGNTLDFVVPFTVNYFIHNNIRINKISAGHFHSAAVDDDGYLYTWGSGVCGVLGHGNSERQLLPKRVTLWQLCADRAQPNQHTAYVPWNRQQEDEKLTPPKTPTKLNGSTWKHGSAKGKDDVEDSRSDSNQQLMITPPTTPSKRAKQESYSPLISSPYHIRDHTIEWEEKDRVVSIDSGAFHMMAATRGGNCFTWGKGDTFALGHSNAQDTYLPTQVQALKHYHISTVVCSMNHSMALADLDAIDDPTSSINLNRPGMVASTPTYESKVHLYFSSSLGSTPTPKSGQFFVPTSPAPHINAPGTPVSPAITSPPAGGFSQAMSRKINMSEPVSTLSGGSQSMSDIALAMSPNATSPTTPNIVLTSPSNSDLSAVEAAAAAADMSLFAKAASEMRILGISATTSAFEKAIYGTTSSPKPHHASQDDDDSQEHNNNASSTPNSSGNRRPSVGSGSLRDGEIEIAPASKPMRIIKSSHTQQKGSHHHHQKARRGGHNNQSSHNNDDDEFPNIATTFRNTIMDTAEYSLVSGRVDAEVAQLRFMLDSSLGSSGGQQQQRFARSEKIYRASSNNAKKPTTTNRFERRSGGQRDLEQHESDNELDSSSSDDIAEDLESDTFYSGSSLVSDPSERKLALLREGSIGLDTSMSSIPPSPRTGSYLFQDQSSTASSPIFRATSSATSPLMDDENDDASQRSLLKASQAISPDADETPSPSPVKFGFTTRLREGKSAEAYGDLSDSETDLATQTISSMATVNVESQEKPKEKKRTGKSSTLNGKSGKKKEKKSKSAQRSGTGGAARFGQLFEELFRKNGNDPNRRAARLDSVQHEMDRKTEKMDSLSDLWLIQLMPRWDSVRRSSSVKKLWRRGIPANIRGVVWGFLIHNELSLDFNVYDAAMRSSQMRYKLWLEGEDKDRHVRSGQSPFHVIDVDVPRTHPETKLFKPGGPFHGDLVSLLHVYAAFDRDMSYVQGMSYLAAFFVTHCVDPFTAFRCFANLLNTHFYRHLFKMDLTQILRHISAYELLFERHLPQLFAHFKELCITPEQYLLDWFMTCFSRAFSLQIASRIFDCLIIEGEIVLYRTALAILKISEKQLLDSDFEKLLPLFRTIAREIDEETLFATIESIKVPREVRDFIRKIALDPLN